MTARTPEWHLNASPEELMEDSWNDLGLNLGSAGIMLDSTHKLAFKAGWAYAQLSNEQRLVASLKGSILAEDQHEA